ncbi:MAG: PadR family transcriptional regulator [Acidobacteria bacterium]|nr:PadR family transcriptional regulator [Acidobacteriota bacterium]
MSKDSLGDLEFLVLLAILRLEDHAYGVSIAEELDERAGRSLSRATIHVTLRRLEEHGLVGSELGAPRDDRGGKPRRYYRVRAAGLQLVRRSKETYSRMWHGLGAVLEGSR